MLFGEGWNVEVRDLEEGLHRYRYIPQATAPYLREAVFSILNFSVSCIQRKILLDWISGD